ncbi:FMN-binding protein [Planctomycetota bacterium]
MKSSIYTLFYAAMLGIACALILTFAASFTAPYKKANEDAEEVKNILLALNISMPDKASSEELLEIYNKNIQKEERGVITVYVTTPSSTNGGSIAIPFAGPGLWGPIKGFLALNPEMTEIHCITFYEQEETPGLGGEIVKPSFRNKFEGLPIQDEEGIFGIIIKSGGEVAVNKVDGISGATMTCDKVQQMLNDAIKSIIGESQ